MVFFSGLLEWKLANKKTETEEERDKRALLTSNNPSPLSTARHKKVSESPVRHPRESGDPTFKKKALDSRVRGNDVHAQ